MPRLLLKNHVPQRPSHVCPIGFKNVMRKNLPHPQSYTVCSSFCMYSAICFVASTSFQRTVVQLRGAHFRKQLPSSLFMRHSASAASAAIEIESSPLLFAWWVTSYIGHRVVHGVHHTHQPYVRTPYLPLWTKPCCCCCHHYTC